MEKAIRFTLLVAGMIMCALAISHVTKLKFESLRAQEVAEVAANLTTKDRERQLDCLARNIYHEAGGEPFEGKVAVAQVTMNRSASGKFPNDICGVVYQKTVVMERVICQFSWYCQNGGKPPIRSKTKYNESYEVAKKVLLEGFRLDSMKSAMYFHATHVSPNWGKPVIGKIGGHIFYKE
jgi:spore germination cell wall hydrolase CwlJ-like protein